MWGPNDWDGWLADRDPPVRNGPADVRALAAVLLRVPDRAGKTVAVCGDDGGLGVNLLFRDVVRLDRAGRGEDRRAHVVVALSPPRDRSGLDAMLARIHRRLYEGGLLLATFPAAAAGVEPYPLRLGDGDDGAPAPPGVHEVEAQYRLVRAGFQGLRLRRLAAERSAGGEWLLAFAARRASN